MTSQFFSNTLETVNSIKNLSLAILPVSPWDKRYGAASISKNDLSAISKGVPGASLELTNIHFDSKGTTDRARIELHWNEAGRNARLPRSVFVKGTPTTLSSRILNAVFGLCESEVRFYNELYSDLATITLKPYVARVGPGGRFVIALEDLGQEATFFQPSDRASIEHSKAIMEALAFLHARYWRSPRFERDLSWIKVYARRPGYTLAHRVVQSCEKWLIERGDAPPAVLRLSKFYLGNRKALDRAWESLPHTLCHGDAHLANTYTKADGTAGCFDWQNIHKMNGMRDVAYFVGHSLTTEQRQAQEENLIRHYLQQLANEGVREVPSFAQAYDSYRLLMMDAWISVWASLAIGGMAEQERGEVLLQRFYETLTDLDTEKALRVAI